MEGAFYSHTSPSRSCTVTFGFIKSVRRGKLTSAPYKNMIFTIYCLFLKKKKRQKKTPGHISEFYKTGLDMLDAALAKWNNTRSYAYEPNHQIRLAWLASQPNSFGGISEVVFMYKYWFGTLRVQRCCHVSTAAWSGHKAFINMN